MKITLNIDNGVMHRLREEAARRGVTVSALVEAGLRRVLDERGKSVHDGTSLPRLPSWSSGGAQVNVADREELHDQMEHR